MDRLQEKHILFVALGALFGPLQRLVAFPEQYNEQEEAEIIARYCAEWPQLYEQFVRFSRGQPGHNYAVQEMRIHHALQSLVAGAAYNNAQIKDTLNTIFDAAVAAISAVPVPRTSVILEAGSPFTAYSKLKQLCEVDATSALIWLDPFMASNIFTRYINSVRAGVPVTLVTSEPGPHAGTRDRNRWNEFLDVSRLYATERGPALYRLIVQPNLHDRWVVFDDKRVYALGGSAKDAADKDYFTITVVEASAENLQGIQDHITTGAEYFGPMVTTHR